MTTKKYHDIVGKRTFESIRPGGTYIALSFTDYINFSSELGPLNLSFLTFRMEHKSVSFTELMEG